VESFLAKSGGCDKAKLLAQDAGISRNNQNVRGIEGERRLSELQLFRRQLRVGNFEAR
jgi:hypothetical protein